MSTASTAATVLGLASALTFIALTPIGCKDDLNLDGDAGGADAGHDAKFDAGLPLLPFEAANLPPKFYFNSAPDIVIAGDCVIDTDMGTSTCWDESVTYQTRAPYSAEAGVVSLPELAIFSMGSLTISQDAQVKVQGARALVLVTLNKMTISGTIDVSATDTAAGPGGFSGEKNGNSAGRGFGPGGAPDPAAHQGAGGGSLCGAGGNKTGGKSAYQATTIPPLVGGSSGGSGFASGGGGGGAIELVCGNILTLNKQSLVRANGGGAAFGGGGGGSGGMILIDAQAMNEFGPLIANGGGGGANTGAGDPTVSQGAPGSDNTTPAAGGKGENAGGAGTGGAMSNGGDGVYDKPMPAPTLGDYSGGGGGGAGLIHVRFRGGSPMPGPASPNASPCYVRGVP